MGAGGRYKLRIHGVGRAGTSTVFPQAVCLLAQIRNNAQCKLQLIVQLDEIGSSKIAKTNDTAQQPCLYPSG